MDQPLNDDDNVTADESNDNPEVFESFTGDSVETTEPRTEAQLSDQSASEALVSQPAESWKRDEQWDMNTLKHHVMEMGAESELYKRKVDFLSKELFILEEEVIMKEGDIVLLSEQLKRERMGREEAALLLHEMETYSSLEMASLRCRIDVLEQQASVLQATEKPWQSTTREQASQCDMTTEAMIRSETARLNECQEHKHMLDELTSHIDDLLLENATLKDEMEFISNEQVFLLESKQSEINRLQAMLEEAMVDKERSQRMPTVSSQQRLATMSTDLDKVLARDDNGQQQMNHENGRRQAPSSRDDHRSPGWKTKRQPEGKHGILNTQLGSYRRNGFTGTNIDHEEDRQTVANNNVCSYRNGFVARETKDLKGAADYTSIGYLSLNDTGQPITEQERGSNSTWCSMTSYKETNLDELLSSSLYSNEAGPIVARLRQRCASAMSMVSSRVVALMSRVSSRRTSSRRLLDLIPFNPILQSEMAECIGLSSKSKGWWTTNTTIVTVHCCALRIAGMSYTTIVLSYATWFITWLVSSRLYPDSEPKAIRIQRQDALDLQPIRERDISVNEQEVEDLTRLADAEHEVVVQQQQAIDLLQKRLMKETEAKKKYRRLAAHFKKRPGRNGDATRSFDRIFDDGDFNELYSIAECDGEHHTSVETQTNQRTMEPSPPLTSFLPHCRLEAGACLVWIAFSVATRQLSVFAPLATMSLLLILLMAYSQIKKEAMTYIYNDNEADDVPQSHAMLGALIVAMVVMSCVSNHNEALSILLLVEVTLLACYQLGVRGINRTTQRLLEKEAVIGVLKESLQHEIEERFERASMTATDDGSVDLAFGLTVLPTDEDETDDAEVEAPTRDEDSSVAACSATESRADDEPISVNHVATQTDGKKFVEKRTIGVDACNLPHEQQRRAGLPHCELDLAQDTATIIDNNDNVLERGSMLKTRLESLRKAKSMVELRVIHWESEVTLLHGDAVQDLTGEGQVKTTQGREHGEDYIFLTLCWLIEQLDGFILQMKRLLQDEDNRIRGNDQYPQSMVDGAKPNMDEIKAWVSHCERRKEEHLISVWKMMSEIEVVYSQILSKSAELLTVSNDDSRVVPEIAANDSEFNADAVVEEAMRPSHKWNAKSELNGQNTSTNGLTTDSEDSLQQINKVDLEAILLPPGILYNLATDFGATSWDDRCLGDTVEFSRSSLGFGEERHLLSVKPEICSTLDLENSWLRLDMGVDRLVLARGYGLRHGWPSRGNAIRRWVLEASTDGVSWQLLRRHVLDTSLDSRFAIMKWPLPDVFKPFRFFQVRMTGKNSSGSHELYLNGFEIYGKIVEK